MVTAADRAQGHLVRGDKGRRWVMPLAWADIRATPASRRSTAHKAPMFLVRLRHVRAAAGIAIRKGSGTGSVSAGSSRHDNDCGEDASSDQDNHVRLPQIGPGSLGGGLSSFGNSQHPPGFIKDVLDLIQTLLGRLQPGGVLTHIRDPSLARAVGVTRPMPVLLYRVECCDITGASQEELAPLCSGRAVGSGRATSRPGDCWRGR